MALCCTDETLDIPKFVFLPPDRLTELTRLIVQMRDVGGST